MVYGTDNMLTTSVIIPTYNRPYDLTVTIASILKQTIKPDEIIVLDDGDLQDPPLQSKALRSGVNYIYIKKNDRDKGLTKSRNIGIRHAKGDIVFFFDDDVELFPDYIEKILHRYEASPEIDGIGGNSFIKRKLTLFERLFFFYDILFCLTGFKKGYFVSSGFSTDLGNPNLRTRFSKVEFLGGASFSFKKKVFKEFNFSEDFKGYGLGEDKEFTYRVSKKYHLAICTDAKLFHYESPLMRYQMRDRGKAKILSKYYFVSKCNIKNKFNGFFFCYAIIGYLLKRILIMLISYDSGEVDRVKGILEGISEIGKIHNFLGNDNI